MNYYSLTAKKSIEKLNSSLETGLSKKEINNRLKKHGLNLLPQQKPKPIHQILISQALNPYPIFMLIIMILAFWLGRLYDFYIIFAILIIEFTIEFVESYRVEKLFYQIQKKSRMFVSTLREGKIAKVSSDNLVPGDIIHLTKGHIVPADARILSANNFAIDEYFLTGEKEPKTKKSQLTPPETPINERINMVYSGSYILQGDAVAIVVATGNNSESHIVSVKSKSSDKFLTPLQKKLVSFKKTIVYLAIVTSIIIVIAGLFFGKEYSSSIYTSLVVALTLIPNSFTLIIPIALIVGMTRLAHKKILIKKPSVLETIGNTSVICLDKTGTMTQNAFSVKKIILADNQIFTIDKEDFSPTGNYIQSGKKIKPINFPQLELLLTASILCNDSDIATVDDLWRPYGDPSESALIAAAAKADLDPDKIKEDYVRQDVTSFQISTDFMATVNFSAKNGKRYIFLKGTPENILKTCSYKMIGEKTTKLTLKEKNDFIDQCNQLADKSYRIYAIAYKEVSLNGDINLRDTQLKYGVVFLGLIAMTDPIRPAVQEAYQYAQNAGINIIIITKDHPSTAINVAKSLGIKILPENVIVGDKLSAIPAPEYANIIENIKIFSRLSPNQKSQIVEFWQQKGNIVTVVGDEIDDKPAMHQADISIVVGNNSDITKDLADIVIKNGDFSLIVDTIKQGRLVYSNIKKTIVYTLSQNIAEISIIILSTIIGLPLPLIVSQIILVNFICDGLINHTLLLEPSEPKIMDKLPSGQKDRLFSVAIIRRTIIVALYIIIVTTLVFNYFLSNHDLIYARTSVLLIICLFSIVGIFSLRIIDKPLSKINILANTYMLYAIILNLAIMISIIYIPMLNQYFGTTPLGYLDFLFILLISLTLIFVHEIEKIYIRVYSISKNP